ncbi:MULTISPECIES: DUF5132 domain-containing protein [Methylocystis]|uniref:DUF5132 domain-containing protein n=1 Tax=Methylocystis iwaonis TaxID=2885079 RepID=A0ABM8E5X6_9HYPH|nr:MULTISPECIES: DUF5132 domain-containing protein [Methylocystis]MBL1257565.1 DUF5132 domain-containing protein [Methylocystis sp. Sn-Cys]MDJ0449144.1 DUF5132 domain-containing protein [Methylocystis sp. JR02]BDV33255.1 hypothetical protein SS37A_07840 [Methylocystis iwaonis]
MALFEDLMEEALGPVAIGIGALLVVPALFPSVGRALRPVAKGAIKTGISVYERTVATIAEATGDLVAEARSELESESHRVAGPERGGTHGHAHAPT